VDGLLLLTFEWEDYVYLGVKQSMHIKQIMLALQRRGWYATHIDHPRDLQRRDRLRRHHNIDAAARLLQRKFRQRYARALTKRFHEIMRVQKQKDEAEAQRIAGRNWWPERVRDYSGIVNVKNNYGKRKILMGTNGWGSYVGENFTPAHPEYTDAHVSRWYTQKLNAEVSERSERALRKTRILAMNSAKWLQTLWLHSTTELTHSICIRFGSLVFSCFIKMHLASLGAGDNLEVQGGQRQNDDGNR